MNDKLEQYRVNFELVNGLTHFYEIDNTSEEKLYELINHPHDGWIRVSSNEEDHFIKVDKITRVSWISTEKFEKQSEENIQNTIEIMNSWSY